MKRSGILSAVLFLVLGSAAYTLSTATLPVPKAGYVDALSGTSVAGASSYVRTYSAVGFDSTVETADAKESISGTVQSFKFSADTKGAHLTVLVKGTLNSDGKTVRYARVDVTKPSTGAASVGVAESASPISGADTSKTKEFPVVGGIVNFK